MNQILKECKANIRAFIRQHFSDQRLSEVYAFNHDDKMKYWNTCGCLMGVTLAESLHQCCDDDLLHYHRAQKLEGARDAELSYAKLGYRLEEIQHQYFVHLNEAGIRRRRLSAILRAEIRRRDHLNAVKRRQMPETSRELVTA